EILESIPSYLIGDIKTGDLERGFIKNGRFRTAIEAVEDALGTRPGKLIDVKDTAQLEKLNESKQAENRRTYLIENAYYKFEDSNFDPNVSRALNRADYSSVKSFAK